MGHKRDHKQKSDSDEAKERAKGRFVLLLAALVVVALGLRVAVVLEGADSAYHEHLVLDSATYHKIATEGDPRDPYWQPPLYPWMLRAVYALTGPSPLAARLVQAAVGAVGVLLLVLLVRIWARDRWALIAGLAAALYGPLIYFDAELLPSSIATTLLLAYLLAIARPWSKLSWLRAPAAGTLLGALGLLLPSMGLMALASLAWLWRREGWRPVAAIALIAALPVLGVAARNAQREPELVLVSWNAGANLWIGNSQGYPETVGIRPGTRWSQLLSRPRCEAGARTRAAESSWFAKETRREIGVAPGRWLVTLARKGAGVLSGREIGRNRDPYASRGESWVLALLMWRPGFPFALLAFAAAAGLSAAWRSKRLPTLLLLAALGILLVGIVFFPTARYRAPALPLLIGLAAIGLPHARLRDLPAGLAALALACVPSGIPEVPAWETAYEIGVDLAGKGDHREALAWFDEGLSGAPEGEGADIHLARGLALSRLGREGAATKAYEAAVAMDPSVDVAWLALSSQARRARDLPRATLLNERAIEADPCNPRHRANLALLLAEQGYIRRAWAAMDEALLRDPRGSSQVERAREALERATGGRPATNR